MLKFINVFNRCYSLKCLTVFITFLSLHANAGVIKTNFEYSANYNSRALISGNNGYQSAFLHDRLGIDNEILDEGGKIRFSERYSYSGSVFDPITGITNRLDEAQIGVAISLDDNDDLNTMYQHIQGNEFDNSSANAIHSNSLLLSFVGINTEGYDPASVVKEDENTLYNNLFDEDEKEGYYLEYDYSLAVSNYENNDYTLLNGVSTEFATMFLHQYMDEFILQTEPLFAMDIMSEYSVNDIEDVVQVDKNFKFWFDDINDALNAQQWLSHADDVMPFNQRLRSGTFVLFEDVAYSDGYGCLDSGGDKIPGCYLSTVDSRFNSVSVPEPSSILLIILSGFIFLINKKSRVQYL
jgi:hypothetical protein